MSFQQKVLVDSSIRNFLQFYDKFTFTYLGLRKQILKQYQDSKTGEATDELKFSIQKLKHQLELLVESYKSHIKLLILYLDTRKVQQPFQNDIEIELKEIKLKQHNLQAQIKDIQDVQRPTLIKIEKLILKFSSSLAATRPVNTRLLKNNDFENNLYFTKEEILLMFQDTTILSYIPLLLNSRFLEEVDGKYFYRVNRSAVNVSANTTSEEYDTMIAKNFENIDSLISEGEQLKAQWHEDAEKLLSIKKVLNEI